MGRAKGNNKFRRNPKMNHIEPIPEVIADDLKPFLADLRAKTGNALTILDTNGRNVPIRYSNDGNIEIYKNSVWNKVVTTIDNTTTIETVSSGTAEKSSTASSIADLSSPVSSSNVYNSSEISSNVGVANGIATLDDDVKLTATQIPALVIQKDSVSGLISDDVISTNISRVGHSHVQADITDLVGVTANVVVGTQTLVIVNGIITEII